MCKRLIEWFKRKPDLYIGGEENPYLLRWHVIPRNRVFCIYLHKIVRNDDDRALHDHPGASMSIVLSGGYYEITPGPDGTNQRRWYGRGRIILRRASQPHRIELAGIDAVRLSAWTLFIVGPKLRNWGFYCPKGWVPWQEFVDERDRGKAGKGCGD